jgi:ketosteroid isomerase-like protein
VATVIERLRAGYEVLNRDGDFSAILDEFDPDVELQQSAEGPEGLIVYRGRDGLARWLAGMSSAWEEISYELLDFEQEANQVLAVVRMSMRGRTSELKLEQTIAHMFTLGENDKVIRVEGFFDPDKARAALKSEVG